jgi:tetratricopeptide (TPR) repeat protein
MRHMPFVAHVAHVAHAADTDQAALAQAVALHNAGQSDAAMQLCRAALARSAQQPSHAGLQQLLATLLLARGEFGNAQRAIASVLAQHPTHAPALRLMAQAAYEHGRVLRTQKHPAPARDAFLQATQAAPGLVPAWFALALAYEDCHAPAQAIAALEHLLTLEPKHVQALINLGLLQQATGRLDAALRFYARAWRLQPQLFGRIAHALSTPACGCLWLHADQLKAALSRLV